MAREMKFSVAADLNSSSIFSAALIDLYFNGIDETPVSFSTTPFSLTIKDIEYLGVGNLGSIAAVEESTEIQGLSMTVTMSGINTSIIPLALQRDKHYQGKPAKVHIAFFNEDGTLIGDPVLIFDGQMDYMNISLGKEATVELTLESKFVQWELAKTARYNSVDQKERFPNDTGLDFIEDMEKTDIPWGI